MVKPLPITMNNAVVTQSSVRPRFVIRYPLNVPPRDVAKSNTSITAKMPARLGNEDSERVDR